MFTIGTTVVPMEGQRATVLRSFYKDGAPWLRLADTDSAEVFEVPAWLFRARDHVVSPLAVTA